MLSSEVSRHTILFLGSQLIFFSTILALYEEEVSEEDDSPFGSSFRTFDATDYSNIATIDVKKNICDLALDPTDHFIAVVESSKHTQDGLSDGACRLFEGKLFFYRLGCSELMF